jgi:hypothetical protein
MSKQKSLIILNEFHEKNSQLSVLEPSQLNNCSNSYTAVRHQTKDGSPILWERKQNSLEEIDNSIVPIHVEKQKTCTCNLHQFSTRKLETNSNPNMALNIVKSSQNTIIKSNQCQCQKCKQTISPKTNRFSAFTEPKMRRDIVKKLFLTSKSPPPLYALSH